MADISLINDVANIIHTHKAHPLSSSGMDQFERTSILIDSVEKTSVSIGMDMGSQRVNISTNTSSEGALRISHQPQHLFLQ